MAFLRFFLILSAIIVLLTEPLTVRYDTLRFPRISFSLVFFAFSIEFSPNDFKIKERKKQKKKRRAKLSIPSSLIIASLLRVLKKGELKVSGLMAPRTYSASERLLFYARINAIIPFIAMLFKDLKIDGEKTRRDVTDIAFTTSLIFLIIEFLRIMPQIKIKKARS